MSYTFTKNDTSKMVEVNGVVFFNEFYGYRKLLSKDGKKELIYYKTDLFPAPSFSAPFYPYDRKADDEHYFACRFDRKFYEGESSNIFQAEGAPMFYSPFRVFDPDGEAVELQEPALFAEADRLAVELHRAEQEVKTNFSKLKDLHDVWLRRTGLTSVERGTVEVWEKLRDCNYFSDEDDDEDHLQFRDPTGRMWSDVDALYEACSAYPYFHPEQMTKWHRDAAGDPKIKAALQDLKPKMERTYEAMMTAYQNAMDKHRALKKMHYEFKSRNDGKPKAMPDS